MITYRKAATDDIDEICGLVGRVKDTLVQNGIFQWDEIYPVREDFLEDIKKGQLYAGSINGRIAVLYTLNKECDAQYARGKWQKEDELFCAVHRLCVEPDFQNKGIAKQTLLYIEEILRKADIHSVRLDVFSDNPFALKLYDSLGYARVGCCDWRKGKFYLMEKYF